MQCSPPDMSRLPAGEQRTEGCFGFRLHIQAQPKAQKRSLLSVTQADQRVPTLRLGPAKPIIESLIHRMERGEA